MNKTILTAILFPITIVLTSLCFEKIGIVEKHIQKEEIIKNVRTKNSTMPKIYIDGPGPINNEFNIIFTNFTLY